MEKTSEQNKDRASASVERLQVPRVIDLEQTNVKLSVEVQCTAAFDKRCDDKQRPNALCFSLGACPSLKFVKVESPIGNGNLQAALEEVLEMLGNPTDFGPSDIQEFIEYELKRGRQIIEVA